jgi:hypothetical protein
MRPASYARNPDDPTRVKCKRNVTGELVVPAAVAGMVGPLV